MANNEYPIPDLSSILATLAQFAPQNTAVTQPQAQPPESTTPPGQPTPDANQYFQSLFQTQPAIPAVPLAQQSQLLQPQQPQQSLSQDPRLRNRSRPHTPDINTLPQLYPSSLPGLGQPIHPQASSQLNQPPSYPYQQQQQQQQQQEQQHQQNYDPRAASQPQQRTPLGQTQSQTQTGLVIDPASITEWTAGLRCVNKIAAQNRDFAGAIKRMIINQQKHEMQWYQSRQELKQTQARRQTGATEIHNILSSVLPAHPSALPPTPTPQQTPEEKEAELSAFDMKVYRAQLAMQDNMAAELKALGVPFFGTNADRILPEDVDVDDAAVKGGEQPKWSPRVTKGELLTLQRKILSFLEDLYKE